MIQVYSEFCQAVGALFNDITLGKSSRDGKPGCVLQNIHHLKIERTNIDFIFSSKNVESLT